MKYFTPNLTTEERELLDKNIEEDIKSGKYELTKEQLKKFELDYNLFIRNLDYFYDTYPSIKYKLNFSAEDAPIDYSIKLKKFLISNSVVRSVARYYDISIEEAVNRILIENEIQNCGFLIYDTKKLNNKPYKIYKFRYEYCKYGITKYYIDNTLVGTISVSNDNFINYIIIKEEYIKSNLLDFMIKKKYIKLENSSKNYIANKIIALSNNRNK